MYWNILKKDLRRKKVMNAILLIFIILATMFITSSINNIVAITTALDNYLNMANMSDYSIITKAMEGAEDNLPDLLDKTESVKSYRMEAALHMDTDSISVENKELDIPGMSTLCPIENAHLNFFDEKNEIITRVHSKEIYVSEKVMESGGIKKDDKVTVTVGDTSLNFTVAGGFKDALLGSGMMGVSRFLIAGEDFDKLNADPVAENQKGSIFYVYTSDVGSLEQALANVDGSIILMGDRAKTATSYMINMVIAGILLVVSVCLILIAFVVLRFTISYTLTDEYREIGVMKAIGIRNGKIRGLYLVKYLALSVVGSFIGFFCGIFFGRLLLASVSSAIIIESSTGYLINFVCTLYVAGIIMLFCFGCTRRIKSYTPLDAIRNGAAGQSFRRKSLLQLSRSRLGPMGFMAWNDILSNLRRYAVIMLTFTLGLTLIIIIVNTINTLKSDGLVSWFSMTESDIYMVSSAETMEYLSEDGRKKEEAKLEEIEAALKEKGMPCKTAIENGFMLTVTNGEKSCKFLAFQGIGTKAEEYDYIKGTPPENAGEIAVTGIVADKLGVSIGDTVTIKQMDGNREYMITALFQSMNNLGESIRLHEDTEINYAQATNVFSYQVSFTDNPGKQVREERIERIRKIFTDYEIYDGGGYVDHMLGGTSGTIDGVRRIIVLIVLIICVLVAVLMERSFIARETGEIAMLKAAGFRNGAIVKWHTIRIGIVLIAATILGVLVSTPASEISSGKVFVMMGAEFGIRFDIRPLEVFFAYPLLMFIVTLLAVLITAQCTRNITASETTGIE